MEWYPTLDNKKNAKEEDKGDNSQKSQFNYISQTQNSLVGLNI